MASSRLVLFRVCGVLPCSGCFGVPQVAGVVADESYHEKQLNTAEAQLGVELMLEKGSTVVAVPLPKPWIVEKELLHRFNMGRGTVVQRVERAAERVFSERIANRNTRKRIRGIRSAQA